MCSYISLISSYVLLVPKDELIAPVVSIKESRPLDVNTTNNHIDNSNSFSEAHFSSSEEEDTPLGM